MHTVCNTLEALDTRTEGPSAELVYSLEDSLAKFLGDDPAMYLYNVQRKYKRPATASELVRKLKIS